MKKNRIGKIIGLVLFTMIVLGISYTVTYYIDKLEREGLKATIKTTFDDSREYSITNSNLLSEEEALLEWPYIFSLVNEGNADSVYQLIIKDIEGNDIKKDSLSYMLYNSEKLLKKGKLSELDSNILYEQKIKKSEEHKYKLYVYKSIEDAGTIYKYSIDVIGIVDGGPGF